MIFFFKISDTKPYSSITKIFFYSIPELSISANLIKISFYLSINDLKKQIASEIHASDNQIKIIDPPNENLNTIVNYYDFMVQINCPNPDADILIPGGKTITIKDCYKMKFDEIIEYLGQEGFYYSQHCIRTNIHLYLSGEEIPREGFHFLSMNKNSKLELKMTGKVITLNCDRKYFTFSENEHLYSAEFLIRKVLRSNEVSILDDHGEIDDELVPTKKYHIRIEKSFGYSIKELHIYCEYIRVDINECYTPDDLKNKIACKHHVSNEALQFDRPIKISLKEIPENTEFNLAFCSLHPDVDVLVPNGKKFSIKKLYKMKFDEILKSLEKEGIYYSYTCINKNLHIYLSGNEIPRESFPIFSVPKNSILEIKLVGPTVTLQYDKYQFTLSENESKYAASNLIQKAFPDLSSSIQDSRGNYASYLSSTEEYHVRVETNAAFWNIDEYLSCKNIFVDYIDTVSVVQHKLCEELKSSIEWIKPEMITIYDHDKNPILDKRKRISSVQEINELFYFKINKEIKSTDPELKLPIDSLPPETEIEKINQDKDEAVPSVECIKINLILTGSFAKKYYSMRNVEIPLNSTIDDLINIVRKKNNIKDKIIIKYKFKETMTPLESTRTINDIKDLIQEKGPYNKIQNIMYIDIESKEKNHPKKVDEEYEHEKKIIPEYKESEESPIKPAPSPRKPFLTKDSDADTSSSEDDYSKKRTPIRTVKDWSPKTKHEREEVERIPNKKQTTSHYKETPEKKRSALEGILAAKDDVPKKRSSSVSRSKFKPKIIPLPTSKKTTQIVFSAYKFEFNDEQKKINLRDDLSIESQEENIRKEFDIEPTQSIIFIFINERGEEENIKNMKQPMKTFKEGIIRINHRVKRIIHKNKIKQTIKPVQKSETGDTTSKRSFYKFKFKGEINKIELPNDSTIESQENYIKNELKIEPGQSITFRFIINDDEDDEEMITDTQQTMNTFQKGTIRIALKH